MISGTVKTDTIRRNTLIKIDQRIAAHNKTAANWPIDRHYLLAIKGQARHCPDDGMHALLYVKRDCNHCACVLTNCNSTINILVGLLLNFLRELRFYPAKVRTGS